MKISAYSGLVKIGSSPTLSGIAAVSSVLAGSLASFFTGSIRSSLALPADPTKGSAFSATNFAFSFEAGIFWFLVLAAAALFALSKYSDSDTDNKHRAFIGKSFHSLQSMPPDAFLAQMAKYYESSRKVVSRAKQLHELGATDPEDIHKALLAILGQLANLAKMYDEKLDREYRVSVMLLSRSWPVDKLSEAVREMVLNKNAHSGVLESVPQLSVISSVEHPNSWPMIDYALPLFNSEDDSDQNIFPGAPEAFATKRVYECNSVKEFLAALPSRISHNDHVEPIRKLYTTGACKGVNSFISLPILVDSWSKAPLDWANSEVIGVVNLESSGEAIVKSAAGLFFPVIQPFLFLLSDLLLIRSMSTSPPVQSMEEAQDA